MPVLACEFKGFETKGGGYELSIFSFLAKGFRTPDYLDLQAAIVELGGGFLRTQLDTRYEHAWL